MPNYAPARGHRWQATLIITLFFAVVGSAAIGWWYARESPPHQGPILLISVDGLPASALSAYGAARQDMPGIDALAGDGVVFERAYTHSPQLLPAHASMLTGQLPVEHGVRDDAGFTLKDDTRTLAELLRNRGFVTGAAVSSFLLRRESGVAQGFSFFDAELGDTDSASLPVTRSGGETIAAAERWARMQDGQRYFLLVQVGATDADEAVTRLTQLLKERRLYDKATIMLLGDRGEIRAGTSLDEPALRVPFIVKQPDAQGAGRRVVAPVQHIDLLPTILDLVRAPIPGGLRGHSLRAVLDDESGPVPTSPIYAESLSAFFRFGGEPAFAVAKDGYRYVRGAGEQMISLDDPPIDPRPAVAADAAPLRAALDSILGERIVSPPARVAAAEEDRLALAAGYLPSPRSAAPPTGAGLDTAQQDSVADAHRTAALLVGQRRFSAAIRALQAIVRDHPMLAVVHYQIAGLLARTGRVTEAIESFTAASELRPEAVDIQLSLADVLLRDGRNMDAQLQTDAAIMLAEQQDPLTLAAAHEMAARVALALDDAMAATSHADAALVADPSRPMPQYVRGRLLYDEGKYDDALAAFQEAAMVAKEHGATLARLHLSLGETLAHLDRHADAEEEFREELRVFPHDIQAYTSLAMLYRAMNRDADVEDVLNELVETAPTPEGYAVAARLWTILGERSRAEALRSDARARFPGDPSLGLLGRDGRR